MDAAALRDTQRWLQRAVIGLNLCPFAKAVHVKGLIHWAVSAALDEAGVMDDLSSEIDALVHSDPAVRDTTMLIVPHALRDFLDFNGFIARGERLLRKRGLEGVIQLASFHPDYRFADAQPGDIENFTNRSPYPILHLLREESVERAVEAFPQPEAIYENNMRTLRGLGIEGWEALDVGPRQ